ncbi:MAG: lectin like domain-containing protein [Actinobacteria bacterium]|nr:lectin like domain-containing protein [Actinomycetota bacterium]
MLGVAVLVLFVAAPLAAAGHQLRAAPLSAEFLRYQAEFKLRHVLGLDAVPGFRPGLIPSPLDASAFRGARLDAARASYPSSYDLRDLGKVSPVKEQRPYGTCWAFATFGSLESCLLPGELRDLSEDHITLTSGFDMRGGLYDRGGTFDMAAAYLIRWGGPVDESDDAYGDGSTPPGLTATKHVQEILYVPGGATASDTANVKYALTTYGAVATTIYWDDSCYAAAVAGYCYRGDDVANHAVTIVGWDDGFAASNFPTAPPGDGAWLVKNSWGTGWGQSGYFWASYYDRYCGAARGFNVVFNGVEATGNFSDIYSYDPLGQTNVYGFSSNTAWGANVFLARRTESIAALGFYTHMPNETYTVYAGASLQTLQSRGSGAIGTPGFHTVALSSPFPVTGGNDFVVAVCLTSPENMSPLAIEAAELGLSSAATALPRQSYVSANGAAWSDLTKWDRTANLCLNAYTAKSAPVSTPTPSATPTLPPDGDTVGPACTAKNVTVKRGTTCKLFFRVYDDQSTRVTKRLAVTTKSGVVKKSWLWGYAANHDGWWSIRYTCSLPEGAYRIVVTGEDLAGNDASVIGRATLSVK